jgi:hypothetical protein
VIIATQVGIDASRQEHLLKKVFPEMKLECRESDAPASGALKMRVSAMPARKLGAEDRSGFYQGTSSIGCRRLSATLCSRATLQRRVQVLLFFVITNRLQPAALR